MSCAATRIMPDEEAYGSRWLETIAVEYRTYVCQRMSSANPIVRLRQEKHCNHICKLVDIQCDVLDGLLCSPDQASVVHTLRSVVAKWRK